MSMNESRALRIITGFLMPHIKAIREAKDSKRRSIFNELIQTERNFVEGLITCEEIYYRPLDQSINSKKPLIDAKTLASLFGNLNQIRDCHEIGILNVMDEILPDLRKPFPPNEKYIYLANKLLEIQPRMQSIYRAYLQTNENSDAILDKLRKHKSFKKFVSSCIYNPKAKCRSIEDFLILPLQRVAGYRCLFERILKYFPEEMVTEHKIYKELLDKFIALGAEMNKEKSDETNQDQIFNISESISKVPAYFQVMRPGRKYLDQYKLSFLDQNTGRETEKGIAFIFNDILILVQDFQTGNHSSKLVFCDAIPISSIKFRACSFNQFADKACLLRTDTSAYNLLMKESKERDAFINFVKKQKKKISHRIKDQTKNGTTHMQSIISEISSSYKEPQKITSRSKMLASW